MSGRPSINRIAAAIATIAGAKTINPPIAPATSKTRWPRVDKTIT
jgi:hypothetical protein